MRVAYIFKDNGHSNSNTQDWKVWDGLISHISRNDNFLVSLKYRKLMHSNHLLYFSNQEIDEIHERSSGNNFQVWKIQGRRSRNHVATISIKGILSQWNTNQCKTNLGAQVAKYQTIVDQFPSMFVHHRPSVNTYSLGIFKLTEENLWAFIMS